MQIKSISFILLSLLALAKAQFDISITSQIPVMDDVNSPCRYVFDEAEECNTDVDCDGRRTCDEGNCIGLARDIFHGCDIPPKVIARASDIHCRKTPVMAKIVQGPCQWTAIDAWQLVVHDDDSTFQFQSLPFGDIEWLKNIESCPDLPEDDKLIAGGDVVEGDRKFLHAAGHIQLEDDFWIASFERDGAQIEAIYIPNDGRFLANTFPECNTVCSVPTFYSECDFGGDAREAVEVADENDCLGFEPQSICIPPNTSVSVFNHCHFEGQTATFTETVSCIGNLEFNLLNQNGISLSGKKDALKKNQNIKKDIKVEVQ